MIVLVKVGRYAGELRDIAPVAARAMIADGRAVNPYDESQTPASAPAETPAQEKTKKKGRK